ncbi:hypothetical protein SH2C18_00620 [Clostridium sediminicola]|uniref:hypothetical protein n=1 Tax=Clostridium sediminicola TaxID=3114879 RepID=UPI0031F22F48
MNTEEIFKKVDKAGNYRLLSFLLLFLAMFPLGLLANTTGIVLTVLIFCVAIFLSRKYKCPVCNHVLDARIPPSSLKFCPNCRTRLRP